MSAVSESVARAARIAVVTALAAGLLSCGGSRPQRSYLSAPTESSGAETFDSPPPRIVLAQADAAQLLPPQPPAPTIPQPLVPIEDSTVPIREPVLASPVPSVESTAAVPEPAVESTAALGEPAAPPVMAAEGAPAEAPSVEPAAIPAIEAPEQSLSAEELYLEAVRQTARADAAAAAAAEVQQRISYPDDLLGGAIVRSFDKPGWVTVYYPLRSVGGVSVNMTNDKGNYSVKLEPAAKATVDSLTEAMKRYLKADEVCEWYPNRNMLVVTAAEESVPFIRDMLEFLDAPVNQIIIEAAVWEVTDTVDTQLGAQVEVARREGGGSFLNLFRTRFDTQNFLDSLVSTQPFEGGVLDFLTSADANHARINLVFQFLRNHGYADLVSQPKMRVAVGQTARIFTGQEIPFHDPAKLITSRLEVATRFRSVGVQLFVTPIVAGQDSVTLAVLPVVSEVVGYTDPGVTGIVNPIIATREAQTQVTVANKELITIGGLDQTKKVVTESKVPILGDIPVLGWLFRNKRDTSRKIQLWFTVQPTIAEGEMRIIVPELTGLPAIE